MYIYIYIWRLPTFFVVFSFRGNLTKPCHCVRIAQFVSQKTVPSIIDKRQILTIRLSVATVIIGALVYRGVPSHLWSMLEQFHHLPGALLPGDNRQCVESPMGFATISSTEKALTLTICDCILRVRSKRVLFYVNFTFVDINIDLRHNVSTSQRSNTEQERVKNLKLGPSTFCRPGGVPIKNC